MTCKTRTAISICGLVLDRQRAVNPAMATTRQAELHGTSLTNERKSRREALAYAIAYGCNLLPIAIQKLRWLRRTQTRTI